MTFIPGLLCRMNDDFFQLLDENFDANFSSEACDNVTSLARKINDCVLASRNIFLGGWGCTGLQ